MKVSVIIPVFNRAQLIAETLDSVIKQRFVDWECIVVDDGSSDPTVAVVSAYAETDARIKLFVRPDARLKGANACRNIGLEEAVGEYIVFFDSDDLMTVDHLSTKVEAIERCQCDYVITRTDYFNLATDRLNAYYRFDEFPITPYNYVAQHINWLTYDICVKASLATSICFNEQLQSGQEYNYFSKLVHLSCNARFIDKVVTLRRHHEDSIRSKLKTDRALSTSFFRVNWYTYMDLLPVAEPKTLRVFMVRCMRLVYSSRSILIPERLAFVREVFKVYGLKGFYFVLMVFSLKLFNKGYWFLQQLTK
ncbi:hypothetical protein DMZ43_11160 [Meridianimaribacter sp. CL38]|uniref:glycosyltransferase family 2 protein n=1 Tax=Meridianimaribacter sp. CL38 TaxID=2213021 RepID=UPI00103C39ED|nr:glycosyltransferase family 2 protein [Meridianimaribacter sp. CL38]TBV25497.1 hypothetical protein DMZ43_11160 [Meridianimaribacter sp. CL38]